MYRVISAILLILILVGSVFYVIPMHRDYTKLVAQNVTDKAKFDELKTEVDGFEAVIEKLGDFATSATRRNKLIARVPLAIDQSGLITDINRLAEKHNIVFSALGFAVQDNVVPNINVVTINTSFEGDFEDLKNLLKEIEVNGRKFIVTSIGVQIGEEVVVEKEDPEDPKKKIQETKRNATFSVTMESFYQTPAQAAAAQ